MASDFPGVPTDEQAAILGEIAQERDRQDAKWGPQSLPDFDPVRIKHARLHDEAACKAATDRAAKDGTVAWSDVLTEEVAEAYGAADEAALREELIQVAATAVAWVEHIDRRSAVEQ